ncbi:hypothetical protein [Thalassovita sp.]|uniref:hypothetical protein n=1 Tax=Thalassovita sp. TaxID=1979401 RepID=UPI0029DE6795|nr:hypothetical protein [Thalassovita sp.]
MRARWLALALWPAVAQAGPPLSAIDWLKDPVPVIQPLPGADKPIEGVRIPEVSVTPLDAPAQDSAGLLSPSVTGLPVTLWQNSRADRIVTLLKAQKLTDLPAMQALFYTLLLAEAEAPVDPGVNGAFLAARLDLLVGLGAVEPAQALVERAGPVTKPLFARWFDATLLTGDEDRACAELIRTPSLAPGFAARIFCTARSGDWRAAALMLNTAQSLKLLSDQEQALLTHFLDPEEFAEDPLPLPPVRPTPLVFRLWEALGEPLPTAPLPRAFAVADLRDLAGWKARIEAAERLALTGALPENRLLGIYSERQPAASGGIWDRVEAIQHFDTALRAGDPGAVARSLPGAWRAMQAARLEVPFARLFAQPLAQLPLSGEAAELAVSVALLSPDYEAAARANADRFPELAFLLSLAQGQPHPAAANSPMERAIVGAFQSRGMPEEYHPLQSEGRVGEIILDSMLQYEAAMRGEMRGLETALAAFRALGLEDTARQAALQALLLTRSP